MPHEYHLPCSRSLSFIFHDLHSFLLIHAFIVSYDARSANSNFWDVIGVDEQNPCPCLETKLSLLQMLTLSQLFCSDLLLTNAVTGVWFWVCWVHLISLSVLDLRQQRGMLQLHNKYWHLVMRAPLPLCWLRIALAPLGPWHFHVHLRKSSVWKTNNLDFDGKCRTSIGQHKKEESLNII